MTEFRQMYGAVYILENTEAQRVKIGMTINLIDGRLKDVNDKWLGKKTTCQICGTRRQTSKDGLMPSHRISGEKCRGGNQLPLEKDVCLAEAYLKKLELESDELFCSEKGSNTVIVKHLKKRIDRFRDYEQPLGVWRLSTAFYTDSAEKVELLAHEKLADCLDNEASFGEVFRCSVEEASETVVSVLGQLGLEISKERKC